MGSTPPIVVYALGGNALSSPLDPDGDGSDAVLAHVISDVLDLLESNHRVVLTHGNGPQVGHLLRLESEAVRAGLNMTSGSTSGWRRRRARSGPNSRSISMRPSVRAGDLSAPP